MEKIVFCDIDGTIMPSNKVISKRTINAINKLQQQGVVFVLCSGRSRPKVIEIAKRINSKPFVICSNGGDVYDFVQDIEVFKDPISLSTIKKVNNICKPYNCQIFYKCGKENYINYDFECETQAEIINDDELKKVYKSGVAQINVMHNNRQQLLEIIEKIKTIKDVEISNLSKNLINPEKFDISCDHTTLFIDINKKRCTKGLGIEKLAQYLNIPLSQTISIGDSINDLSMFEKSQVDIAVANSIEQLKQHADILTKSNNNDGVAKFLEKHFNL